MSSTQLFANITASSTTSSFSDSMFNFAAIKQDSINSLNELSASSNIRISTTGSTAFTNEQGIATFTLDIVSGINGVYSIVVSNSEGVSSSPSNPITFTNAITALTSTVDITQTAEIQKLTLNSQDSYIHTLNPQPVISVTKSDGTKITGLASYFIVYVISVAEIESAYDNLGLSAGSPNPGVNSIALNVAEPSSPTSQATSSVN